ncbi:hypothetical protein MMC07_006395 [Pseudocyphellaria aurata]|nr:hypothetical protein [Pseudocyphellaria aurata]
MRSRNDPKANSRYRRREVRGAGIADISQRVRYIDARSQDTMDLRTEHTREELAATKIELECTRGELAATKIELECTREDLKATQETLNGALGFIDRINSGEIINASYTLFGHTSTSKSSKVDLHRRLVRQFDLVFAWARQRLPDLRKSTCERMLMLIDPAYQNPWISARNQTAHKITIREARASSARQGNESGFLSRWVDLVAIHERDGEKFLDEVALRKRMTLDRESAAKPLNDMRSMVAMLKSTNTSEMNEFVSLLSKKLAENSINDNNDLENPNEPRIEFADSE